MGSDSTSFSRHIKTLPLVRACSLILLALRFFAVSAVNAADFTGPAVSVLDGDTIEVLHNHRAVRILSNGLNYSNNSKVAEWKRVEFNGAADMTGYRAAGNC